MTQFPFLAQQAQSVGPAVFGGVFFLLVIAIVLLFTIFWIWMLIDCLSSKLPPMEKLVWVLVIIFLHGLGALLYFVIARKKA